MTQQYQGPVPGPAAPVTKKDDTASELWYNFFVLMSSLEAKPVQELTVGNTPYVYEASTIGHLHVAAGSDDTSVILQRGDVTLVCPTSGFVPVAARDRVTVHWQTVEPTIKFLPGPRI